MFFLNIFPVCGGEDTDHISLRISALYFIRTMTAEIPLYTFRYLFMLIIVPTAPSSAPTNQFAANSSQRTFSNGIRLKNPNICHSVRLSVNSENTDL